MRDSLVTLVVLALALGPRNSAAQWGGSAEIGAAWFTGTSRDSTGATVGPYRPTTFAVRLDRGAGPVRLALGVLYAEPGLAGEQGNLTFVQHGVVSLVELSPEVALRLARFGAGVEARVEAGPVFDLWDLDGEGRNRVGARGGVALEWPLARALTGSLRVARAGAGSLARDGGGPGGVGGGRA